MYLLVYALRALRYLIYSVVHLLAGGLRYTRYALLDSDTVDRLSRSVRALGRHLVLLLPSLLPSHFASPAPSNSLYVR